MLRLITGLPRRAMTKDTQALWDWADILQEQHASGSGPRDHKLSDQLICILTGQYTPLCLIPYPPQSLAQEVLPMPTGTQMGLWEISKLLWTAFST